VTIVKQNSPAESSLKEFAHPTAKPNRRDQESASSLRLACFPSLSQPPTPQASNCVRNMIFDCGENGNIFAVTFYSTFGRLYRALV